MSNEATGPDTETRDTNRTAAQAVDAGLEKIATWSTHLVVVSRIDPGLRDQATPPKTS